MFYNFMISIKGIFCNHIYQVTTLNDNVKHYRCVVCEKGFIVGNKGETKWLALIVVNTAKLTKELKYVKDWIDTRWLFGGYGWAYS